MLTGSEAPASVEDAISVASLAELRFGVLIAGDYDEPAGELGENQLGV